MNKETFFKLLPDTILEDILMIQADEYIEPDNICQDNEKILGEMNDLEKAVYTLFAGRYKEAAKKVENSIDTLKNKELSLNKLYQILAELKEYQEIKFFQDLFWLLLEKRLGSKISGSLNAGLGVRKGFSIVALSIEDEAGKDCDSCPLKFACHKTIDPRNN